MKLPFLICIALLTPLVGPIAAQQMTSVAAGPSHPVERVAAPTASDYVICPEDQLQVSVWKEPSLSGTLPVRPDGKISLALIGDFTAAGFTPLQLSEEIRKRLGKFVTDPSVTVTIVTVHADKVYLLGEVGHVGPVIFASNMNPLQAIAAGGGLTPYASAKRIYILRTKDGKQEKIPYNYKKALKDGDQQGVALLPNDTIVVP
jgi:polysaccharide export outer membrane protein